MRFFCSLFLSFSLLTMPGCLTPIRLTGKEECALIGEVYMGSRIGERQKAVNIGDQVFYYDTKSYNPICKVPQTEEEKTELSYTLPQAIEKKEEIKKRTILSVTSSLVAGTLFLLLLSLDGFD